ncbi:GNAT family N-acetyltransferase [Thalassorhabdomicrobium marinisediminis]|uniref:GNAT family N-acetyltransferase n=1 Tax=Thalassorhabdomicrobium marinisediminis TaxID=2170577 RepID=UPI002490E0B5|nr:GNAT family N-acetyltransferase [Thalassorhabdomicrobium marinisediminis]
MNWRPATPEDAPEIEAFLQAHIETSVFLLSNLRKFGATGAAQDYAMTFYITGHPVSGVVAQSTKGVVMAQWPGGGDWARPLALLPAPITGAIGDGDQIDALLRAAGLRDRPTNLNSDEVLYALTLSDLIPQDGPGTLRPLTGADRAALIPWRTDYQINILGEPEETARAKAADEIAAYIAANSHRVLEAEGVPLAMTGFNAEADDLVQVGGVYTPPAQRGRGLARRAVALHLAEARAAGKTRAILFADNPSAQNAYEAVGFAPIGRFAMIFFKQGHAPR